MVECKMEWWCPWHTFSRKKNIAEFFLQREWPMQSWASITAAQTHSVQRVWDSYQVTKTNGRTVVWPCMGLCRNNVTQILLHPENKTIMLFLHLQNGLKFAGATVKANFLIFSNSSSSMACYSKVVVTERNFCCYGYLPYPASDNTHLNFNSGYDKWREKRSEGNSAYSFYMS